MDYLKAVLIGTIGGSLAGMLASLLIKLCANIFMG